jgi:signal transduction histidine kinase
MASRPGCRRGRRRSDVSIQPPGRRSGSPSPVRRTVLVAGGDETFRRALAAQVEDYGLQVEAAGDAAATLPTLVRQAHASLRRTPVAALATPSLADRSEPFDPDLLPIDATPADVGDWLRSRLPLEVSPDERLRLTLAHTADDRHGEPPATHLEGVDWQRLFAQLADGAAVLDGDGTVLVANGAFAALLGLPSADAARGRHLLELLPSPPEALDDGLPTPRLRATVNHDGQTVPVELTFSPAGPPPARLVFVTIADQRWRQAAADAQAANFDLTEQLRRSQKIGALGRLAGGVAHDFNNLLQVIGGYAETLGAEGLDHASRRRLLQRIQRATDRAASLTRQLLAFGRRQVLVPQVLDLNVTVLSLEHMLGRVIGEDVHFVSSLAPDLRRVRVDPGQIEQVLLNLAINSRDAMSQGGTLEVATANFLLDTEWSHPALPVPVPPGDWVLMSVVDTGAGMDADTAAQAFEPFFTTKDASHGSGLGLSMVYGIVKQSGGFTWIDTSPGAGTSVHVLLPAVQDDGLPAGRDEAVAPGRDLRRGGTVLLVEDDPEVRTLFTAFLRDGGYDVREAGDGEEALQIFEQHAGDIDVVMTDVVMPNISGPSLASALRARKPDVRVLFVSGYTDTLEMDGHDPLAAHVAKPVTRSVLLAHVAALLGHDES